MTSCFQSGGREQTGSGGKILRGRRKLLPFSPYSRPSSAESLLPLTIPETQAVRNPSWIRGLISVAGGLISSVLGSGGGSSLCESSSEYSDEDRDPSPNEMKDHLNRFNVRETMAEGNVKSLAIVPKSETKLVIEHLLMQETFSRDECNKLVELICSRVQDQSAKVGWGNLNEVLNKTTGNGPWQYLNQNMDLPGTFNHSPSNLASFSSGIYRHEADTHELRKKAVMEAKKWFEDKQLSPNRTYEQEHGVCILNPDTNKYGFNTGRGSPIDMAKSYMQSLPPWRSPYFSTVEFKIPPQSMEHTSHNIGTQMLPTSKAIERDYLAIGSWDQESLDNGQENSKLSLVELTASLSVCEASKTLATITNVCSTGQDKILKLHDGKAVEVDHAMETDDIISQIVSFEPKQAFNAAEESEKAAALTTTLEPVYSNIDGTLNTTNAMDISDNNLDLEIPLLSKEQVCSISCQDSPVLASAAGLNNGDCFRESEILLHKNHAPAEPSLQKKYDDKMKLPANISSQVSHYSDCKQSHSITDSKPPDENAHDQEKASASARKIYTNGLFSEANNINSDLESMNKGDPTTTNSSKAAALINSEGTHDVSSDIPGTHCITDTTSRPRKGMKTRSTEQVPLPSEPSRRGNLIVKKVVRPKRGRG